MTRAISIGWPDLIEKCRSIFPRYSHGSLIGQFGNAGKAPLIPRVQVPLLPVAIAVVAPAR